MPPEGVARLDSGSVSEPRPSVRSSTYTAADGITGVDTWMGGRAAVTSGYLLHGDQPALVETGPTTSVDSVLAGLAELDLGPEDLAHIVLTHIHLDHAGGVGTLARHFPGASVWVQERGAPHLADPAKLMSSAGRVYGEERLRTLFGPMDAVPSERLRAIVDGDEIDLGGRALEVLYTPGHASHHVALKDSRSGAVFTGDAMGIHLPDVRVLRPATPPPDIDVEAGVASIERIREAADGLLLFSHFGPVSQVDELCEIAQRRLRKWADIVHEAMAESDDLDRVAEILDHRTADEFPAETAAERDRYELLADMRMNAMGLIRYWTKRAEREAARGSGSAPSR